jgi:tetratricopeptide (TPR) repeat protein
MRGPVLVAALAACLAAAVASDGSAGFGRALVAVGLPDAGLRFLDDPAGRGVALYRAGRFTEAAEAFRIAGLTHAFDRGDALARAGDYRGALEAFDAVLATRPGDADAAANRALVAAVLDRQETAERAAGKIAGGAASTEKKRRDGEPRGDAEDQNSTGDGMAGDKQAGSDAGSPGGSKAARKGAADTKAKDAGQGQANGSATDSDGVGRASVTDAVIAKAFEQVRKREMGKSWDAQAMAASRQWLTTLADDPGRYLKLRIAAEHARRAANGLAPEGDGP